MKDSNALWRFAHYCLGVILLCFVASCAEGTALGTDIDSNSGAPGISDGGEDDVSDGPDSDEGGRDVDNGGGQPSAGSCESDADCEVGERCVATVDGGQVSLVCGEANPGGGEAGQGCTDGSQCAQNICYEGACAVPCEDESTCDGLETPLCDERQVQVGSVSGGVKICVEPVFCQSPADCDEGQTCVVDRSGDEVQTYCREQEGNRSDGTSCSTDSQCASNYCHEGRFGKFCATPCVEGAECPGAVGGFAMECGQVEVPHNSGSEAIGLCTRTSPAGCSSQEDCGAGERCQFIVSEDGGALETLCVPGAGGNEVGKACTLDTQCQSGLCLEGSCSAPCVDRGVCGDFQVCDVDQVEKDGATGVFDICKDIEIRQCDASIDCSPADLLACNVLIVDVNDEVDALYCGPKNPGMGELGARCEDHAQCDSDLCWQFMGTESGECTEFCEEGVRDCGVGQVCRRYSDGIGLCLAECSRQADCEGGTVCDVGVNETGSGLHYFCSAPNAQGQKLTGESCTTSGDCVTGHCLTLTNYESTGQNCVNSSTCPTDYKECICPPNDPNCPTRTCSRTTERSACSEVCDPANGDSDCAGGGHDMTVCSDNVGFEWQGGVSQISLCTFGG